MEPQPPAPAAAAPAGRPQQRCGRWTAQLPIAFGTNTWTWLGQGPSVTDGATAPVVLKIARTRSATVALNAEAELLRRCAHPHIVRLVDSSPDGAWFAMDRIEGTPWHTWAAERPLLDITGIALEIADALRTLHAAGFAHVDLKPQHALVDSWGHAHLIDLGSATRLGEKASSGMTPGFVAPELLGGGAVTPAADVYSLAACLYAALTGVPAVDGEEPAATLHAAMTTAPLPVTAHRVDIPATLEGVLHRALSRDPSRRPDLDQVIAALLEVPARPWEGCAAPVVGMLGPRRQLQREVSRAATGRPTVVLLYGPPGSGRRTLAGAALAAAGREGMLILDRADPAAVLEAAAAGRAPAVMLHARRAGSLDLALRVLRGKDAALVVLWASRPEPALAELSAPQLSPTPLTPNDVRALAVWCGVPAVMSHEVWSHTQGHPEAAWAALIRMTPGARPGQRYDRTAGSPQLRSARRASAASGRSVDADLSRDAQHLLAAVRSSSGAHSVTMLARTLKVHPVALLDECVALEAAGLILFSPDGDTVRATGPAGQPGPAGRSGSTPPQAAS